MKQAVVIHPRLTIYGGGEMIALHVIKTLQELDYEVSIATDNYNPAEVEQKFRMGKILEKTQPILLPQFKALLPNFVALQHIRYATRVMRVLKKLQPDLAFSTQSALYHIPNVITFHIVYDMADLFEIHAGRYALGPLASVWKRPYYKLLRTQLQTDITSNRRFIPLSHALEEQLAALGYPHSTLVYPPCDMIFKPAVKKKQVLLVSRIAPQKRVEEFMGIARTLPAYRFILVGADSDLNSGYAKRVFQIKPPNVEYIEARIRDRPELVEESKVYLYTSLEPGIGIALGQAMGAGCIPVTPAWGGGSEMIHASGVGYTYRNTSQASNILGEALESDNARDHPILVSTSAKIFSSENFEQALSQIINQEPADSESHGC